MNYINFEAGNKSYKLRLTTRSLVLLEKTTGFNPLAMFGLEGDTLPTITNMVAVLHASLQQFNHGITMSDAYDIFDDYLADGHDTIEFIKVIMDLFKESGIVPKAEEQEKNE